MNVIPDYYLNLIKQSGYRIVAVGANAFSRTNLIGLGDDLFLLCIRDSKDLIKIRESVDVVTLESDFGNRELVKINTANLLMQKDVQDYLSSGDKKTAILVYKNTEKIEKVVSEIGAKLLAPKSEIRSQFEDKELFRKMAASANLVIPKTELLLVDHLDIDSFYKFQEQLGNRLVFQLTDYAVGGGIGTFFVKSREEFEDFWKFIKLRRSAGDTINKVNVSEFIEGESVSLAGCITKYGVLLTRLQKQLTDIDEVVGYVGRNGVFCGHEWGGFYCDEVEDRAKKIVMELGLLMEDAGYKGIFGVDLVVNKDKKTATIIEVNARYTGAFPTLSMLQRKSQVIPLDLWHVLELMEIDYSMDFEKVQKGYETTLLGAQLLINNTNGFRVRVDGDVKSGLYELRGGELVYIKDAYDIADITDENQLILTDGIPKMGTMIKGGGRIGRLFFGQPITSGGTELSEKTKLIVAKVYEMFGLSKLK